MFPVFPSLLSLSLITNVALTGFDYDRRRIALLAAPAAPIAPNVGRFI